MKPDVFGRLARLVTARPAVTLGIIGVLAIAGAALATQLEIRTGISTLVSGSSDRAKASDEFKQKFGDDAVVVLVEGDLQRTLLSQDLTRLAGLELCLSGKVPARAENQLPAACRELKRMKSAQVVYGPGTFIDTAVNQINGRLNQAVQATRQRASQAAAKAKRASAKRGGSAAQQRAAATAASRKVQQQFTGQAIRLAGNYGLTGLPSLSNSQFISKLVFDSTANARYKRTNIPKARFASLFPSSQAAVVQVRLRPSLSDSQRSKAIGLIRTATRDQRLAPQQGARYVVSGIPVVVDALASSVRGAIFVLLGAAVLLMAATLLLVFHSRPRLLPLLLALAAAALTFGALAVTGGTLTMASIAVLPVMIGLAVDYAIQFQARHDELRRRRGLDAREAAVAAASAGGPTIAAAGLATAAGFLVLLLSPVPLVRGFGLLLVVGVLVALVCTFAGGLAALVLLDRRRERHGQRPRGAGRLPRPRMPGALKSLGATWLVAVRQVGRSAPAEAMRRTGSRVRLAAVERSERMLAAAMHQPRRVLAIGAVIAVVGLVADTQSEVISDVQQLVPGNLPALRDVNTLQRDTGVAGEIDVTVRAADITSPGVIRWMSTFQQRVLREGGYRTGATTCRQAKDPPDLCPSLSLPDLFQSVDTRNQKEVRGLLDAVPAYFSQSVVSRDRKSANLAFGVRLASLSDQKKLVDSIESNLDPPKGVTASVVGFPALAAEANAKLSSPVRRLGTVVAALVVVFLVLLAFRRKVRDAALPLVPIALATGWASGLMFVLGLLPGPLAVELNPMSVTLSALVIAISTEFSVLLAARYRQERENGAPPRKAIELAYASTGAAVLASGATAIVGFAALIFTDIRLLRDFGILTVVDLGVSLAAVMFVLPAALLWAEEHGRFELRDFDPRPVLSALRPRRTVRNG